MPDQAPKEKGFTAVQKIINAFATHCPDAASHLGKKVKILEAEIIKLLPEGAEVGSLAQDLQKQVDADAGTLKLITAKNGELMAQIQELTTQSDTDKKTIQELNDKLAVAIAAVPVTVAPPDKPADAPPIVPATDTAAPQGAASGENSASGGQG